MCLLKKQPVNAPPKHRAAQKIKFTADCRKCLHSDNPETWQAFAEKYHWDAINASLGSEYEIISRAFLAHLIFSFCEHPFGHIGIKKISVHVLSMTDLLEISYLQMQCSREIIPLFIEKTISMQVYLNLPREAIEEILQNFQKQLGENG